MPEYFNFTDEYEFEPEVEGCRLDTLTFRIEPLLPDFLELDEGWGTIFGNVTLCPEMPPRTYTIFAANEVGSVKTKLQIGIRAKAPESISYIHHKVMVGLDVYFEPGVAFGYKKSQNW